MPLPVSPRELVSLTGLYNHSDFGIAVAPVGDLTGDGIDDFAVGAKGGGTKNGGYVAFYSGASTQPFVVVDASVQHEFYGSAIANAGDLDGDGMDELAVGAWGADEGPANSHEGRVDVPRGRWIRDTGWGIAPIVSREVWVRQGSEKYDLYGSTVTALGDLDGDGASEVGIGATQSLVGLSTGGGYVDVVSGRTGELLFRMRGATTDAQFGRGIAGPGDIDGDGRADVAIGLPFDVQGGTYSGSAIVVQGLPNVGTPVCAANATANSSGSVARLVARGSTSKTADAMFLELTGAPLTRPVLFLRGSTTTLVPFGNGVWCAGGQVVRIGRKTTDVSGAANKVFRPTAIQVGSTLVFQAWLDDPLAGGAGFNASDAASLVVVP